MTEEQFEEWSQEDVRAEWVDGEVILLSPANIPHIRLNRWLWIILQTMVEFDDSGEVLGIEAQIRLEGVIQRREPDLVFVSNSRSHIIHGTYIDGPPDLIVEIVSPDSQVRDWHDKYIAYETSGVREYWVIDPGSRRVEAFSLGRAGKFSRIKEIDGRIRSKVIRRFYLRPEWIWKTPLPKLPAIFKELGLRG